MTKLILGNTTDHLVDSVAQLKTLDLRPGSYARTVSYTSNYLTTGSSAYGGSYYEITTLAAYRAKILNNLWVPDGIRDFYLDNGNLAVDLLDQNFDSVAAMKLQDLKDGQLVSTSSYYNTWLDGSLETYGGATYQIMTLAKWQALTGGTTPDGYGDHVLDNGAVARLIIIEDTTVDHFGAIRSTTVNSTLAIKAALLRGGVTKLARGKSYLVNPTISRLYFVTGGVFDLNGGTLYTTADHSVNGVLCTVDNPESSTLVYSTGKNVLKNGSIISLSTPPGSGNKFPDADLETFFIAGSFNSSVARAAHEINVTNVYFKGIRGAPFLAYECNFLKVTECHFENIFTNVSLSVGACVQLQGCHNCIVSNNTGKHDTTLGLSWHWMIAVSWVTGSTDIVVTGNSVDTWNGGHFCSLETNDLALPVERVVISNNTVKNFTGGTLSNLKGANKTIVSNNTCDNLEFALQAIDAYNVEILGNYFANIELTAMLFQNCYGSVNISNNTLRNIGTIANTSSGLVYEKGIGIYYVTTGTASGYEPDSVIISGNKLTDINGTGIFCTLTGGNTSMRGIVSDNLIYRPGIQASGAATSSLVGITAVNCSVHGNYIISNSSTTQLAISEFFSTKACYNNTVEGTYVYGKYAAGSSKSVWSGTTYFNDGNPSWIEGKYTAYVTGTITLADARAPFDAGDVLMYTNPQTVNYIGAVRMANGLTAGGFKNFGLLV